MTPHLSVLLALVTTCLGAAPAGPWDVFNLAPESRTVYPRSIHGSSGIASGSQDHTVGGNYTLPNNGSYVTLDFGFEVGGLVSLNFDSATSTSSIALAFTESPEFIRPYASDDSANPSASTTYDGVLQVPSPLTTGYWIQPPERMRGGFRYLTVSSTSNGPVTISNISCTISFMPHVENLRSYDGYFYASDPGYDDPDFLTKIWYSGAYTVQTNIIPVHAGRQYPPVPSPGWLNNATVGIAGPILVDGAKRDRTVWPGDMGVAVPTLFVSTQDLVPAKNSLSTLFALQNPSTGALPYAGPPFGSYINGSDTYHAWTLIGAYNYFLYSGDIAWLKDTWSNYTKAVQFLMNKVDHTGLLDVTDTEDWGRLWQGGHNSEANAIFYKVLISSAELAAYLNVSELVDGYSSNATSLKTAFNDAFWSSNVGMYRNNLTSTLYPQDANSLAVLFNLTTSAKQASSVSAGLTQYWGEFGSVSPELPDTVTPYIGSFELQAHFASGNDARAIDLLHLEWGYMLYTNISVQSTLLEGYTSNGSLYYRSSDAYDYDPAFTSHSHGWSTGPTSALTFYVLGLTVTSPQGRTWSVAPHLSGLPSAEGGFETPLGWYGVQWTSTADAFNLTVETPTGTSGIVTLPVSGTTSVDGNLVQVDGESLPLSGGNHTISVQF